MKVCLWEYSFYEYGLRLAEIPITNPEFWDNEEECTDDVLKHVFRSATEEPIPLMEERIRCLREAGQILCDVCLSLW